MDRLIGSDSTRLTILKSKLTKTQSVILMLSHIKRLLTLLEEFLHWEEILILMNVNYVIIKN